MPSPDTLERLFSALDPVSFEGCFRRWVNEISHLTDGEVIAIDGKTIRGSYDSSNNVPAKHIVSAYATEAHLCLGQQLTDQKSNEITAIPKLLDLLSLKGCTISIDAMGCQTQIALKIRKQNADYLLAVKQNQESLHEQIVKIFGITKLSSCKTTENVDHGRVELRTCSVINDLTFLDDKELWPDLQSIIKIESVCFDKTHKKETREARYYISKSAHHAETYSKQIRSHWAIENNLHWMLDVSFGEDRSRRRKNNHAINFNMMAKTALGLIKNHQSHKKMPYSHKKEEQFSMINFSRKSLKFKCGCPV